MTIVFTLMLSFLAALIAAYAAHINNEKLRLQLFQKRLNIYLIALDFHYALVEYDPLKHKTKFLHLEKRFLKAHQQSWFMFKRDSGIYELLSKMHTRSYDRTRFKDHAPELAHSLRKPEQFPNAFQQSEKVLTYNDNALAELRSAMEPYLMFDERAAGSFFSFAKSILPANCRYSRLWTRRVITQHLYKRK